MKITNRYTGETIYENDKKLTMRDLVIDSLKNGAKLRGAYLLDAYLCGANIRNADIRGANLRGANLFGADIRGANLCEANLSGANLSDANLRGAYLCGADLRGADLRDSDLRDADIRGANLCDADIYGFYLGKDFGFYHRSRKYDSGDYLKIGCEGHSLKHWLEHYKVIGRENAYSESETERYGDMIKMIASWNEEGGDK